MEERLTSGRTVWVQDPALKEDKVFFKGTVKEDDGKQVTVLPEGGGAAAVWKKELVLLATTNTGGVKDHTMLDVLNEATLLDNTHQRFLTDSIQTYISEILIVTNPFKRIPGMYDQDVMEQYKGGNWNKLEPHVFATAEMAYTHMITNTQSQSLLVAGESGAGKTECNKQLLNFLVWRAGASGTANAATLSKDILDTNPVLEAFGNAKTVRNNNSSRFGKYLNIKFNTKYQIMGAEVRTFLLEKSRVSNANGAGERSYHIYFQMMAGAQMGDVGDLGLPFLKGKKCEEFHYLNQTGTTRSDAIDDAADFRVTHSGLSSCGLDSAERAATYQVVAALLYLGETALEANGDDATKITASGAANVKRACELLGIADISVDLVEKLTVVGVERYQIQLKLEAALKQRDALAKQIYALLFDLLVAKMNQQIDTPKQMHKFIGLLDVFGFEVFQNNSFEQLCINYANERLHNFFLMRVFEVEIELYRMQSLEVPPLDYPDNAKVIELLEKRPTGIFPALDSQCKMPKATDLTFAAALHKAHKEQPHFSTLSMAHMRGVKLRDEESFVVRHYAADVCYGAAGFLEKNSDALSPEFEKKLRASSHSFVRQLVTGAAAKVSADGKGMTTSRGGGPGSMTRRNAPGNMSFRRNSGEGAKGQPPQQTSVSAKFLKSLTQLMKEIATTHPYFVRCLKPNHALKPGAFNAAMILRQLQCSGTVECVKLMQSGYPNRAPYADLHARFRTALPAEMGAKPPKDFVKELLLGTDCQPGEYQMGQDMVFFKGSKGAVLQELMLTPKEHIAAKLLAKLKEKEPSSASIAILEKYIAQRVEERKLARAKLTAAVHAAIDLFEWNKVHLAIVREKRAASVKMQAIQRGKKARRELEEMKATGKALEVKQLELKEEAERRASEAAEEEPLPLSLEDALTKAQGSLEPIDEEAQEAAEHEAKWFAQIAAKGGKRYHRFLMCKGVEWGFQYHNFYGDWELDYETPLCNDRPHYKHNTMYGGYAHLFHCMDPHYHVPRWVIGPAPGNENGWAFCESDAPTPWENTACWISWDGFEWHTCKNFRFVPKEHELDGLSDEEGFDDEAEMEAYQAEQQRLQEEEAAARRARAEAEKKAAPAANGGGPAPGQVNNQAHKPTPRSSTPKAVAAGGPKAAALGSQAERASKGSRGGSSPSSKKAALKAADDKKEKSGKKPSKKEEKPKEEKPKEEKPKKEETRKKLGAGLFGGKRKK